MLGKFLSALLVLTSAKQGVALGVQREERDLVQSGGGAKVCFMMYMLADNNLEYFIRQNLLDLTDSPGIRNPDLVTWVYFDSRNYNNTGYDITAPLPDVFNTNGTALTTKYQGSQYLTWDHAKLEMVVNTTLPGEQNSENTTVVSDWLAYALSDCIARGATQFFAAFSDHGAGFAGFGVDENKRRRHLIIYNERLVEALQTALTSVANAPQMYDVIGFDACLMSSFDALDDYRAVTKYYLASEAVVPGLGWAYKFLNNTETALSMAEDIQKNFLEQAQGPSQQTPKTMAVVESANYTIFLDAWDALCSELTSLLVADNDPDYFALLQRARTKAISFNGYLDSESGTTPSCVDIGSFLTSFEQLCNINPSSNLRSLYDDALTKYNSMFIVRGDGPGTVPGTGMHITWPFKQVFKADPATYDFYLLNTSYVFATSAAPNWLTFLSTFYTASTPTASTTTSVCLNSASGANSTGNSHLLLDPEISVSSDGVMVSSPLAITTDYVFSDYGIDLTFLLTSNSTRRRLQESVLRHRSRRLAASSDTDDPTCPARARHLVSHPSRRLQEMPSDYFVVYGGQVYIEYDKSSATGSWDRLYYLIGSDGSYEPAYVTDNGDGSKSIAVCYFSPSNPVTPELIGLGLSVADAKSQLGCQSGFLTFSTGTDGSAIVLYTYTSGNALSELPPSQGGQFSPIVYMDYQYNGTNFTESVGGFNSTVINYGLNTNLTIIPVDAVEYLTAFGASTMIVALTAEDFDTLNLQTGAGIDTKIFQLYLDNSTAASDNPTKETTMIPSDHPSSMRIETTAEPTQTASSAGSSIPATSAPASQVPGTTSAPSMSAPSMSAPITSAPSTSGPSTSAPVKAPAAVPASKPPSASSALSRDHRCWLSMISVLVTVFL